ncbi:MAG: hypothetical protein LBB21_02055 [Holosporaceae bacterium]|jgi:hypothetical protein|nr:hypothetical protein [Holosporaceae bacterium]
MIKILKSMLFVLCNCTVGANAMLPNLPQFDDNERITVNIADMSIANGADRKKISVYRNVPIKARIMDFLSVMNPDYESYTYVESGHILILRMTFGSYEMKNGAIILRIYNHSNNYQNYLTAASEADELEQHIRYYLNPAGAEIYARLRDLKLLKAIPKRRLGYKKERRYLKGLERRAQDAPNSVGSTVIPQQPDAPSVDELPW